MSFPSAHRTDEQARDELMAHLGDRREGGWSRAVIPMRIGRTRNSWVKNSRCHRSVSRLHRAAGIDRHSHDGNGQFGGYSLTSPDQEFSAPKRDRYNKLANNLYDEVRDFYLHPLRLG